MDQVMKARFSPWRQWYLNARSVQKEASKRHVAICPQITFPRKRKMTRYNLSNDRLGA